jgi:hypothetical protein
MEHAGYSMAYSGNDDAEDVIDLNEDDLGELENEIEHINS